MRLAVFSDIHSNYHALTACIDYALHLGAEGFVFLGDNVTDCPYPQKTIGLLREIKSEYPSWFVRGNREDSLIKQRTQPDPNWVEGSSKGSMKYTFDSLTADDLDMLEAMPLTCVPDIEGCSPVRLCHAAPQNNYVLLYPGSENLDGLLRELKESVIFSGHSHFQYRYEAYGRQVINPGTLGMPSHGQVKAQFAVASYWDGRWAARLMNIEYDKMSLIRDFEESGLLEAGGVWTRSVYKTFKEGGNWTSSLTETARRLSPGSGFNEIPEKAWLDAAQLLGI